MIKKVVSAVLLLLVIAGTALASTYVYTCMWPTCGLIQQFKMSQGLLQCPKCGHMMTMKQSYE